MNQTIRSQQQSEKRSVVVMDLKRITTHLCSSRQIFRVSTHFKKYHIDNPLINSIRIVLNDQVILMTYHGGHKKE